MKSKYNAFPRRWFTETLASEIMTFDDETRNYKMVTIDVKWHSYDAKPPSMKARDEIARALFGMVDAFDVSLPQKPKPTKGKGR